MEREDIIKTIERFLELYLQEKGLVKKIIRAASVLKYNKHIKYRCGPNEKNFDVTRDTKYIVGHINYSFAVYNTHTGECEEFGGFIKNAEMARISPCQRYIVTCSGDDEIMTVWDFYTKKCVRRFDANTFDTYSIVINGDYIIQNNSDNYRILRIWNIRTGESKTLTGHTDTVYCCNVSSCGKYIVSGSFDNTIKVWHFRTGECIRTLVGHIDDVNNVLFSGKQIISCADDDTIRIWDFNTGKCMKTLSGHREIIWDLAVTPCGRYLASSTDRSISIWDMNTGKSLELETLKTDSDECHIFFEGSREKLWALTDEELIYWEGEWVIDIN